MTRAQLKEQIIKRGFEAVARMLHPDEGHPDSQGPIADLDDLCTARDELLEAVNDGPTPDRAQALAAYQKAEQAYWEQTRRPGPRAPRRFQNFADHVVLKDVWWQVGGGRTEGRFYTDQAGWSAFIPFEAITASAIVKPALTRHDLTITKEFARHGLGLPV